MVFEAIFEAEKLLKEPVRLFILAVVMSFLGILTAFFLFPEYTGIMAVAFIALLLFPFVHNIFKCEAQSEFNDSKVTFFSIVAKHFPIFKSFILITAGIFFVFLVMGFIHPPDSVYLMFKPQLYPISDGMDVPNFDFNAIAQNNLKVLYVTFGISMIYGAGVMIMLSWNASVWGVILGTVLRKGVTSSTPLWSYFLSNMIQIVPHLILETLGYLGAAVSGGLLAMCVVYQRVRSKRFLYSLTDIFSILTISIILILISAFIEINI